MHDVNGKEINAGDYVNVVCRIVSVDDRLDGENLHLAYKYPCPPAETVTGEVNLSVNNHQVVKSE